ncbi:MAG: Crp/Fnr family transcriptional regulator [Planctomycetota bacterium]
MKRPSADDLVRSLKRCALFSALPVEDVRPFAAGARALERGRGERIFHEGDRADGFYVVDSGRVKVFKSAPDGREQILHMVEAGGSFGEAAVFYGGAYPAGASALTRSRLVYVDGAKFLELVESRPDLAVEIMASLSARLMEFARLIEALSLREVSSRLAKYLLDESARADSAAFELPCTKAALAARLGTVAETLSRALSRLARRKLVETSARSVRILDPEGLARVSAGLKA